MEKGEEAEDDEYLQEGEVDFHKNPTILSRLIMMKKCQAAISRLQAHREEADIWVCIRSKKKEGEGGADGFVDVSPQSSRKDGRSSDSSSTGPPSPASSRRPPPSTISSLSSSTSGSGYTLRRLPIHLACSMLVNPHIRSSLEPLILSLIVINPDGCGEPDHEGRLPLHEALWHNASVVVISMLLMAYPNALIMRDRYGRTPFDLNRFHSTGENKVIFKALLSRGVQFWEMAREEAMRRVEAAKAAADAANKTNGGRSNGESSNQRATLTRSTTDGTMSSLSLSIASTVDEWRSVASLNEKEQKKKKKSSSSDDSQSTAHANMCETSPTTTGTVTKRNNQQRPMSTSSTTTSKSDDTAFTYEQIIDDLADHIDLRSSDRTITDEDREFLKLETRARHLEIMLTESYAENYELGEIIQELTSEREAFWLQIEEMREDLKAFRPSSSSYYLQGGGKGGDTSSSLSLSEKQQGQRRKKQLDDESLLRDKLKALDNSNVFDRNRPSAVNQSSQENTNVHRSTNTKMEKEEEQETLSDIDEDISFLKVERARLTREVNKLERKKNECLQNISTTTNTGRITVTALDDEVTAIREENELLKVENAKLKREVRVLMQKQDGYEMQISYLSSTQRHQEQQKSEQRWPKEGELHSDGVLFSPPSLLRKTGIEDDAARPIPSSARSDVALGNEDEISLLRRQKMELEKEMNELSERNKEYELQVERLSLAVDALKRNTVGDDDDDDDGITIPSVGGVNYYPSTFATKSASNIDQAETAMTRCKLFRRETRTQSDAKTDLNCLIEALESQSRFATERFLANKVRVLEAQLESVRREPEEERSSSPLHLQNSSIFHETEPTLEEQLKQLSLQTHTTGMPLQTDSLTADSTHVESAHNMGSVSDRTEPIFADLKEKLFAASSQKLVADDNVSAKSSSSSGKGNSVGNKAITGIVCTFADTFSKDMDDKQQKPKAVAPKTRNDYRTKPEDDVHSVSSSKRQPPTTSATMTSSPSRPKQRLGYDTKMVSTIQTQSPTRLTRIPESDTNTAASAVKIKSPNRTTKQSPGRDAIKAAPKKRSRISE